MKKKSDGDPEGGDPDPVFEERFVLQKSAAFGPSEKGFGVGEVLGLGFFCELKTDAFAFEGSAHLAVLGEGGDDGLALFDLVGSSGLTEPLRQGFFAEVGVHGVKKLEEGALSEDIEILGVRVIVILEAFTASSEGVPTIFDAIKTALAYSGHQFGVLLLSTQETVVRDCVHKSRTHG